MTSTDMLSHKRIFNKRLFIEIELRNLQLENRQLRAANQKLEMLNYELELLAMVDPLTCLPNRGSLISTLNQEIVKADRYHHTRAVLFLDLNYFKTINDTWYLSVGDMVLQEFSKVVLLLLRRDDTFGRLAGDEFLVILPKTKKVRARQIANHIHTILSKNSFTCKTKLHLTRSIGIATYLSTEQECKSQITAESLIAAADKDGYANKKEFHSAINRKRAKRLEHDNF